MYSIYVLLWTASKGIESGLLCCDEVQGGFEHSSGLRRRRRRRCMHLQENISPKSISVCSLQSLPFLRRHEDIHYDHVCGHHDVREICHLSVQDVSKGTSWSEPPSQG
jgi:hypothetical protein